MKKSLKITAIVLASLILLVAVGMLLTQTQFFKARLLSFALGRINPMLNAEVAASHVTGNLFDHIELYDVRLIRDDDTVGYIQQLKLAYEPWALLKGRIEIDSLIIDSLALVFRQYPDRSWNIEGLMKQDSLAVVDTATEAQSFGFDVVLGQFILRNSHASVVTLDATVHRAFEDIVLHFSGLYTDTLQRLDLVELQVEMNDPEFRLERLAFEATRSKGVLTFSDLIFETEKNRIGAEGSIAGVNNQSSSGQISSDSLDLSEFSGFVPGMKVSIAPQIAVTAELNQDTLVSGVEISDGEQAISLELTAYPISQAMSAETRDEVHYSIAGELQNIDVPRWTGDTTFAYVLNGSFDLAGRGVTPEVMETSLTADLSECLVLGREVGAAVMDLDYQRGNLTGTLRVDGGFGSINFDGIAIDLLSTQAYDLSFSVAQLDLAQLLNNARLKSDLNMVITAKGRGFESSKAGGSAQAIIRPSTMYDIQADTGMLAVQIDRSRYQIDTAFLATGYAEVHAGGELSNNGGELSFTAVVNDFSHLQTLVQTDTLRGSGNIIGTIAGPLDSLSGNGIVSLEKIQYNAIMADTIAAQFDLAYSGSVPIGEIKLVAEDIHFGEEVIDSVAGYVRFPGRGDSSLAAVIDLTYRDTLAGHVDFVMLRETSPTFVIHNMDFSLGEQRWTGGSPGTVIQFIDETIIFKDLVLQGGELVGDQPTIGLDGRFSMSGREDLRIDVTSLGLTDIGSFMKLGYPVDGRLSGTLVLRGTAAQPSFEGWVSIIEGRINQFTFDSLGGTFDYEEDLVRWNLAMAARAESDLGAEGYFPLHLSFVDTARLIVDDQPMEVRLSARRFPLEVLTAMSEEAEVRGGVINANLMFENTWLDPDMSGDVQIHEGSFVMEDLGVEYSDLEVGLSFDDNTVSLDSLRAARGDGFLQVQGTLEFDSTLLSGSLRSTDFSIISNDMYLVRHDNFVIQVSGHTQLQGSTFSPTFSGDITVDQSRLYVPVLTDVATRGTGEPEQPPMLVAATKIEPVQADTIQPLDSAEQRTIISTVEYFRNLRGSILLNIPRNTWLRSPEMNIEISGDLRLVKDSPEDFELFGGIEVVRGEYTMYGKEFQIREGTLTFTGGSDYDADLNITAEYTFRSPEREKRVLVAEITGRSVAPQVAFNLDGVAIPEQDALAYVAFGRSMDEVTAGGGGSGISADELAKRLAASTLAGQLAKTLGDELALDVIEIDAASSLQGATVTIGKYITTNLFMSYQRGIGNPTEDEITPTVLNLEYELTRKLAVQLVEGDPTASGVDLIYKIDW